MKIYAVVFVIAAFLACNDPLEPNREMAALLHHVMKTNETPDNIFSSHTRVAFYDSIHRMEKKGENAVKAKYYLVKAYLENGEEDRAIAAAKEVLDTLSGSTNSETRKMFMKELGIAWLRVAEKTNCLSDHNSESCIFPIQGNGIHRNTAPAIKAVEVFEAILKEFPDDLPSRWLLNVAYMTIDGYPENVPPAFLIPSLDTDTVSSVKPFVDAAIKTGLDVNTRAGGTIIEDFNNDGYLDVVTSSESLDEHMHYFINNGDGTFSDASEVSGLKWLSGGLNIMQTDYNNDGWKDIFVTRRGWKSKNATEPKSLLKNNKDGTFTDVTASSGLMTFYQSQSATWADFNNDGWLDVFVGNEAEHLDNVPCELFINNKNGTFTDVSKEAGVHLFSYVKGVSSGDFDNDGLQDIFISSQEGKKVLLRNKGSKKRVPEFEDVTVKAGITNKDGTSTTWFWDYDNDGWLDIFIISKKYPKSPIHYFAAEALGMPLPDKDGKMFLYRNKQDGTFEEVSEKVGLDRIAISMGANFGDIDNDGYQDFYLGTGNLDFSVLVPNKLFKNVEGRSFVDITTSARVGNLQKGHGVSIADLDNDGDQDIYIDLGGAYKGDAYHSSLYLNPGQNENKWVKLILKGVEANRSAIGARIKVYITENGVQRMVSREVNSGGSFGANALLQHIGIGSAASVDKIEIRWPGTNKVQEIGRLAANALYTITEGNPTVAKEQVRKMDFLDKNRTTIGCAPLRH